MSNNLAGYEFIQAVGKGAMGSVYLARQTALNRFVAIKQVLGAWNGDPQALERFRREARALAKMNHPNVVGIYNLEAVGSDLYMIQEYVHGPSLKQVMTSTKLNTGQALRVISEVSAALEYASKQNILHRDLKPGNVFVTTTGVCKLGDFGLVKMMGGAGNFVTAVGTILGTPSYMSPEQAEGKAEIDQRADVYSLAVMSYEMLVGRLPFPPVPGNVMASVEAHISTPPPKPSQVSPGFPGKVEDVLLAGLAKDPKKRPKSAGEFWVKLADAAQKSWPGWAGDSDLAAAASAIAPPAPSTIAQEGAVAEPAGASTVPLAAGAAAATAVAGAPPPPMAPMPRTISPLDTTALMAGSEQTVMRPGVGPEDTIALGHPDETMVQPMGDETIVQGGGQLGDETVVQPPQSIHAQQPGGAPAFMPMPQPAAPAPSPLPGLTFSAPQVNTPVYKPPKTKQGRGFAVRLLRALVALLILAILAAAALWYLVLRNSGPAVLVTGATISLTGVQDNCASKASKTYTFSGQIVTNGGAGTVKYNWQQPDGKTVPEEVAATKGNSTIPVSLAFTYSGHGSASGEAKVHVTDPNVFDSNAAGVQYRCP